MTLEAGAKLGPYQIVAPIGAGGMGEVFRARDTRLLRDVAVKVLPASFASDPERRARFEQEARAASALNHPNIITVLDIGDADGVLFIAMEYVEGKTLRELLAAAALPSRKVLEIAEQMADGLAKAHSAGILHRDLKPDNVMVSKDGFVKILDFGLAKLAAGPANGVSELETVARPATSPGAVVGTVGYMSPEQASGHPVDFRSDQFSLGAVLYEMVTGTRPFARKTNAETMVAIIREEPEDAAKLNPRSPAPLRWLIERCLEKDPEDRFASTRDLARDLGSLREHLSESSVSGDAQAPGQVRHRSIRPWAWGALGLAVGFGLAALAWHRPAPPAAAPTFTRLTFRRGTVLSARFAPDGQTVVYSAAWEGLPPEIFTVRLDGPESRSLGLPSADVLSVSPTGELAILVNRRVQWGFEGYGTLARVPLGGGSPRDVAENVGDADWAPDGSLAVARDTGLQRRPSSRSGRCSTRRPAGSATSASRRTAAACCSSTMPRGGTTSGCRR
jgi:eukaryotic-like serine/threonine-protein kinase